MTRMAVYSVLRFLGISDMSANIFIVHHYGTYTDGSVRAFEEIRHHHLFYTFPKVYRQNKYLGE